MNPDTEKNINEAIDWLQQTGGSIQDFAVEQAPLYCREVVAWEFWNGIVFGGIGGLLTITAVVAGLKFKRFMLEDDMEPNGRTVPAMMIAILGIIFGPVLAASHIPSAIKAAVAPRLVIVEHLRALKP